MIFSSNSLNVKLAPLNSCVVSDIDFPNMNTVSSLLSSAHFTDQQRNLRSARPQTENKAEGARERTHWVHPLTTANKSDHSCKLHSAQPSEINALTSKEIEYEK